MPSIPDIAYDLTGLAAFGIAANPDGVVPRLVWEFRQRFGAGSIDTTTVPAGAVAGEAPATMPVPVQSAAAVSVASPGGALSIGSGSS